MKKFNVIDLFCGCGGFSKGFEEAGFKIGRASCRERVSAEV